MKASSPFVFEITGLFPESLLSLQMWLFLFDGSQIYPKQKGVNENQMARVEVDGDLERALKKFNKKVTDERILAEYKKRERFTAKKKRKKRSKRAS
jgi:ribosomal protein S21